MGRKAKAAMQVKPKAAKAKAAAPTKGKAAKGKAKAATPVKPKATKAKAAAPVKAKATAAKTKAAGPAEAKNIRLSAKAKAATPVKGKNTKAGTNFDCCAGRETDVEPVDCELSTDACQTCIIMVHPMIGDHFELKVSTTQTLRHLKHEIASQLGKRWSDLAIVFQGQLIGGGCSERSVVDYGLGDGNVIEIMCQLRSIRINVIVTFMHESQKSKTNFGFKVPRNCPCAAQIKEEIMRICGNTEFEMTNPVLFLAHDLNWFSFLGNECCLDDWTDVGCFNRQF